MGNETVTLTVKEDDAGDGTLVIRAALYLMRLGADAQMEVWKDKPVNDQTLLAALKAEAER